MDTSEIPPPKKFQSPKTGERINHRGHIYFLGKFIDKGSFAKVYECRDEWDNELVAKVILPRNKPYEEIKERWLKELNVLTTLRHPNVTYVYDAFECDDTFYLIIERCVSDLSTLFKMKDFTGNIWFPYIAKDLLQAIHYIHSCGYVHKDIHPGNVFISWIKDSMLPSKEPVMLFKIGDLGISRLESDPDIFNTTLAKWMLPPEFLNPNEFGKLDRRIDIYHTGLLLLSILLGHIPTFSKSEILQGKPREEAERIKSPFGPIVAKALRRHVKDRTSSALDFWRDIRNILFDD